ncbi:MAG: alpha/beta hydrolase [Dehalococcoidia bacterium]|nr:alpha/beta hydrolase [Dehalococcoidia bacterium]
MALHPQVAAALKMAEELNLPELNTQTPEAARASAKERTAAAPTEHDDVYSVRDTVFPGPAGDLPIRIYTPSEGDNHSLIVWFHGGGWVIGDLDNEDPACRVISNSTNSVIVSIDYRLSPDVRFPEPVEDCYAGLLWAHDNASELGVDASRIGVAGTSAGGNLSAAVSLMARDRGGPKISHQVLFCPVIDHDFGTASYSANADGYMLSRDSMIWFWEHYLGPDGDGSHPYASPIRAESLAGLPAATIITAEYDPLVDEAEAYAEALKAAGNDVTYNCYEGMIHGFNGRVGIFDRSRDALAEATTRLNASLSA